MKNVAIMLGLLLGGCAIALLVGAQPTRAGRCGLAAVFIFTALGHFMKRDAMVDMIPPAVPARSAVVFFSGVLEVCLAVLVVLPAHAKTAGMALAVFLVLVTPMNIYAAIRRVDFGGHASGPRYLFVRLPLQALLLAWTYWFAIRPE